MKKITSLLMLFLLFVGAGYAEMVNGIEQTAINPTDLSTGYYAIKCVNKVKTNHNGKFVKYNVSSNGLEVAELGASEEANRSFIWYIQCNGSGADKTVTIKQASKNAFWPIPDRQNLATLSSSAVNLKIASGSGVTVGGDNATTNPLPANAALIHENATEGVGYFHLNDAGNGYNFLKVGCWDDTNNGSLLYAEFYPATYTAPAEPQSPIVASTLTADGLHFDQMHWYTLNLHDLAAVYEMSSGKTYLNNMYNEKKNPQRLYAFVGDPTNGYEIYNCVAGPGKILWSEQAENKPILMTAKAEGQTNTKWLIEPNTAGTGCYTLVKEGTGNENACINDFSNNGYLAYWVDGGAHNNGGSKMTFTEVPEQDLANYLDNFKNDLTKMQDCVGGYSAADVASAKITSVNEISAFCEDKTPIAYQENGIYNIRAQREVGSGDNAGHYIFTDVLADVNGNMDPNAESNICKTGANADNVKAMWRLEGTQGDFVIRNLNSNLTLGTPTDALVKCNAETHYNLVASHIYCGVYSIKTGANYLHDVNTNNNIRGYGKQADDDFGSAFCLLPVKDIKATISDAQWATACWPVAVTVPETGVKVYYVSNVKRSGDADVVYVTEIAANATVPAKTPVLLNGAAATYSFAISSDNAATVENNKLWGTTVNQTIDNSTYYGLKAAGEAGKAVFVPYQPTDNVVLANKALLPVTALPQVGGQAKELRIVFDNGDVTGIDNVLTEEATSNEFYDLSGRRVFKPTKGIFVNGNGQKVFIK